MKSPPDKKTLLKANPDHSTLLRAIFAGFDLGTLPPKIFVYSDFTYLDSVDNNLISTAIRNQEDFDIVLKNIIFLYNNGVSLFDKNKDGETPLEVFFKKGFDYIKPNKFERIRKLSTQIKIDMNKIIFSRDRENLLTLLGRERRYWKQESEPQWQDHYADWLIDDKGINLNYTTKFGYTALDVALLQNNTILAEKILERRYRMTNETIINALKYAPPNIRTKIEAELINDGIGMAAQTQSPARKNKI